MGDRGFVKVEGGRLYYERDGDGPAVVLIHGGLFLDLRMWEPQVQEFAKSYTFVRFDLRGYGRSSEPPEFAYRHCDDLKAVLEALGIDGACVGGHSFGATVAIDFALAYPGLARGLILAPALPVMGWQWVEGFPPAPALKLARTEGVEAAMAAFLELPLAVPAMKIPEVAARLRQMLADYSGWHLRHRDPAIFEAPDAVDRLADITAPALVMVGGLDVVDGRLTADKLSQDLVDAEHHIIEHVGHNPNMEDPATFNALTLKFIDKIREL